MWRKGNPCALLVGIYIDTATLENSMEVPQKLKNRTTIWFSNTTSEYLTEGNEITISKRYLHSHVYCSIIYNSQDMETPKYPPMDEWIKKMWGVCVCIQWNGTLATRKKEILPFATIYVDLEGIMLVRSVR